MEYEHVKTIEQARALPEILSELFEFVDEIDPVTHHTIRKNIPRKFYVREIDDDDIIFFTDADGRSMQVVGSEAGPAKTTI